MVLWLPAAILILHRALTKRIPTERDEDPALAGNPDDPDR